MKISRPDQQQELAALQRLERLNEQKKTSSTEAVRQQGSSASGDRVELSLAKKIQEELSPQAVESMNRDRIEMIKQKIANGTYQMPGAGALSEKVAREITMEILTNKGRIDDDE